MKIINTAELSPKRQLGRDDNDHVYNGLDCCLTLEVLNELHKQTDNQSASTYAFSRDMQGPVMDMTLRGLRINHTQKEKVLAEFKESHEQIHEQFRAICRDGVGLEVNHKSPTQLLNLFYDVLKLPKIRKKNANGVMAPTVNRDALERISREYWYAEPIALHILALRDLDKKITFLETGVDPDGRMRTSFNIAGTNTGRLSSSISDFGTGGNLQNVDRLLRSVFIPDEGMKFANVDLGQGDSRNLGAMCWEVFVEEFGEEFAGAYLDACESGDLHSRVAKMAYRDLPWGTDVDRVIAETIVYRSKTARDLSKALGHGSNFVGQPNTMAKHAKLPVEVVRDFQNNYFRAFPCIKSYHDWVYAQLNDGASLTTLYGRRRRFYGRPKDHETLRDAVAYIPQSMTADAIDTGLIRLWRADICQLLVQVHDSILFQYPEELEDEIVPKAIKLIENTLTLKKGREFTIPADAKTGWNWGDQKVDKKTGEVKNPNGLVDYKIGQTRERVYEHNVRKADGKNFSILG